MQNIFLGLVILASTANAAEVYATDTNGYVDQTAWKEQLLQDQYQGEEEVINREPRIIEERVTAPPRVLTEKVTTEPKVISESLELPIRQRIITQPTVLNKTIRAQPQFIYGQNEVIERQPVFLPAQQTYQKVEKNVTVPGNTVEYYTYVQPKEHTIYQKINVNEANVRKQELQPIFKGV